MWVFGYGSLVWRPDFPFRDRRPAFVRGWKRRFWQGSTDHRGVPEAPGRVVTLLPEGNNAICWGTAYELEWDTVGAVVEHLDYRERGGYAREDVDIHFNPRESVQGTVYIATTDNENYLGETDIHAIATQIARSVGPSGANTEYLLRLAQALRDMGADDPHVYELEQTVLGLAPDLSPTSAQSPLQWGPKSGQADD
jgi:cation transport protein ChaC